ncbi:hypothetical protein BC828DRAFT_386712 [Blastocladiella britannica]|nr:hypothetical protein BC828DRAFT_386712 [Blastocladiella britannica]
MTPPRPSPALAAHAAPLVHVVLSPLMMAVDSPSLLLETTTTGTPASLSFADTLRPALETRLAVPAAADQAWLPMYLRSAPPTPLSTSSAATVAATKQLAVATMSTPHPPTLPVQDRVRLRFVDAANAVPDAPSNARHHEFLSPTWFDKTLHSVPAVTLVMCPLVQTSLAGMGIVSRSTTSATTGAALRVVGSRTPSPGPPPSATGTGPDAPILDAVNAVRDAVRAVRGGRVVLGLVVAEAADLDAAWFENRVAGLRRALALDRKSVLVMSATSHPAELADNLHAVLVPLAISHYTSKLASLQKKRASSTNRLPSRLRYEIKLGMAHEAAGQWSEALNQYTTAYRTMIAEYLAAGANVSVSDGASGLLLDAETLATAPSASSQTHPSENEDGEEESSPDATIELFGDAWYSARDILDGLVLRRMKLSALLGSPADALATFTHHLHTDLLTLPDSSTAAPSLSWLVHDHAAGMFETIADALDSLQLRNHPANDASQQQQQRRVPTWLASFAARAGAPAHFRLQAAAAADRADEWAAQGGNLVRLMPGAPAALSRRVAERVDGRAIAIVEVAWRDSGLVATAVAAGPTGTAAPAAQWPRAALMVGTDLAARYMASSRLADAMAVLTALARSLGGHQSGGVRANVLDRLATASKTAGDWKSEAQAQAGLAGIASSGRDQHFARLLALLDASDDDHHVEATCDAAEGLMAVEIEFAPRRVAVDRPTVLTVRIQQQHPGIPRIMDHFAEIRVTVDPAEYSFVIRHRSASPDDVSADAPTIGEEHPIPWAPVVHANLRGATSGSTTTPNRPLVAVPVTLSVSRTGDVNVTQIAVVVTSKGSNEDRRRRLVISTHAPPPPVSTLVRSSNPGAGDTGRSHRLTSSSTSNSHHAMTGGRKWHLSVLPPYSELECVIDGPSSLLVHAPTPYALHIRHPTDPSPRTLAAPLVALVHANNDTLVMMPGLDAPVPMPGSPTASTASLVSIPSSVGAANMGTVLVLPFATIPVTLEFAVWARHAAPLGVPMTVSIADAEHAGLALDLPLPAAASTMDGLGSTTAVGGSDGAAATVATPRTPVSPSVIDLGPVAHRRLSAILAPINAAGLGLPSPPPPTGAMATAGRQWITTYPTSTAAAATGGSSTVGGGGATRAATRAVRAVNAFNASFSVAPAVSRVLTAAHTDSGDDVSAAAVTVVEERVVLVDLVVAMGQAIAFHSVRARAPSHSHSLSSSLSSATTTTIDHAAFPGVSSTLTVVAGPNPTTDGTTTTVIGPGQAMRVAVLVTTTMDAARADLATAPMRLEMGALEVTWTASPANDSRVPPAVTKVPIPALKRDPGALVAEAVTAPTATQYSPHPLAFQVTNASARAVRVQVSVEAGTIPTGDSTAAAAQFAGEKNAMVTLLPFDRSRLDIVAVPLAVGPVALARCRVRVLGTSSTEQSATVAMVESPWARVFVLPEGNSAAA